MTFHVEHGDLFESGADALVNPVNCKGVMGAGVAKQMMERYPEQCNVFNQACKNKTPISPGRVYVMEQVHASVVQHGDSDTPLVLHATTKDHWKDPSRIQWMQSIATRLRHESARPHIDTVAMPALGCGHGGLDWVDVRGVLEPELAESDVQFTVYLYDG